MKALTNCPFGPGAPVVPWGPGGPGGPTCPAGPSTPAIPWEGETLIRVKVGIRVKYVSDTCPQILQSLTL